MLRPLLLSMARNQQIRDIIVAAPLTGEVVQRYVAGEQVNDAIAGVQALVSDNLLVTIDRLGEDVLDEAQANQTVLDYERLLEQLDQHGLANRAEVSVKLSAVGQALGSDGQELSYQNALRIAQAAQRVGTTVTLDAEDHTTTDATLATLRRLRETVPSVGAVLQAYLYRTEDDARQLAYEGSRVRLCKGAYKEPETVAYQSKLDVDLSYVRCMKTLIAGAGYPMFATHDPRLVEIGKALTEQQGRAKDSFEFQMLLGIRPDEQRSLAAAGYRTRVYLPYGADWYGYFMRRLAERPANLMFFARSLISKG